MIDLKSFNCEHLIFIKLKNIHVMCKIFSYFKDHKMKNLNFNGNPIREYITEF